ncbi:hypothetical protein ABNF65_20280, partial [Paenibacillus larvae]
EGYEYGSFHFLEPSFLHNYTDSTGEQLTQTSEDLFKEIKFIFSYNTKKIKKMEDNDSLSANEYFVFRNLLEERIDINKQLMKGRFLSSQLVGIQLKYMN